jgi:hypothetical protein
VFVGEVLLKVPTDTPARSATRVVVSRRAPFRPQNLNGRLDNRVDRGIGFEIARQIGKAGHRVLLGARDATRGKAAAAKLDAEGIDVRFIISISTRSRV